MPPAGTSGARGTKRTATTNAANDNANDNANARMSNAPSRRKKQKDAMEIEGVRRSLRLKYKEMSNGDKIALGLHEGTLVNIIKKYEVPLYMIHPQEYFNKDLQINPTYKGLNSTAITDQITCTTNVINLPKYEVTIWVSPTLSCVLNDLKKMTVTVYNNTSFETFDVLDTTGAAQYQITNPAPILTKGVISSFSDKHNLDIVFEILRLCNVCDPLPYVVNPSFKLPVINMNSPRVEMVELGARTQNLVLNKITFVIPATTQPVSEMMETKANLVANPNFCVLLMHSMFKKDFNCAIMKHSRNGTKRRVIIDRMDIESGKRTCVRNSRNASTSSNSTRNANTSVTDINIRQTIPASFIPNTCTQIIEIGLDAQDNPKFFDMRLKDSTRAYMQQVGLIDKVEGTVSLDALEQNWGKFQEWVQSQPIDNLPAQEVFEDLINMYSVSASLNDISLKVNMMSLQNNAQTRQAQVTGGKPRRGPARRPPATPRVQATRPASKITRATKAKSAAAGPQIKRSQK